MSSFVREIWQSLHDDSIPLQRKLLDVDDTSIEPELGTIIDVRSVNKDAFASDLILPRAISGPARTQANNLLMRK